MTEELKNILQQFWLLDSYEYSIIKDLIRTEIEQLDNDLDINKPDESNANDESIKRYYESKRLRDSCIVMKEKVDYIISMGLCKK